MSDNNRSNIDQIRNLNPMNFRDENVLETLTKCVDDTLTDIKKCLNEVLDLRGKYLFYSSHIEIQMTFHTVHLLRVLMSHNMFVFLIHKTEM
jgi:hypothetical protein